MSFPLVCSNCGAPSGPSTGVCPFCKSIAAAPASTKESRGLAELKKLHQSGNLPRALSLCAAMEKEDPKQLESVDYLMTFVRILLETEGPSSRIRSLLGKAFAIDPGNAEVAEYLEIVEAKSLLTKEKNDAGEKKLAEILRRSSNNVHALFLLGADISWGHGEPASAVRHLEKCVRLHPKFLRAWGCLGALYEKLGNRSLAAKAFRECVEIETEPGMKDFFQQKIRALET